MASTTSNSLRMKFKDAADANKTITLSRVKGAAALNDVKALVQGIITNGLIWKSVPTTAVSAQMISTTVTDYNLE